MGGRQGPTCHQAHIPKLLGQLAVLLVGQRLQGLRGHSISGQARRRARLLHSPLTTGLDCGVSKDACRLTSRSDVGAAARNSRAAQQHRQGHAAARVELWPTLRGEVYTTRCCAAIDLAMAYSATTVFPAAGGGSFNRRITWEENQQLHTLPPPSCRLRREGVAGLILLGALTDKNSGSWWPLERQTNSAATVVPAAT